MLRKALKTLVVLVLLGGMALAGVAGWNQFQPALGSAWTQVRAWIPLGSSGERTLAGVVTESVRRGPFRITVTERGTLDSLKNSVLASKVEGTNSIISIVPEGTHVKQGDLVCELDSSVLVEKETQQQISVTTARSNLQSAMEAVEIQKTQNDSDIAAAQLKLTLAELDLKKFEQGDYEQQKGELAAQLTLAREKVAQAEETFQFTSRLVKKGYKTQTELESARITLQTERINCEIAEGKLKLLQEFTKERTLTELKANAAEFRRELDRVKRKAASALAQAEADLSAKRLTFDVETSQHNRVKEQIALCKIYAPQDGQVIYANSRDGRSSDQVLIEEGSSVRERQPIVNLPDLSEMKVNARIHESRISLLKAGLPVTVRVDAFSDRPFDGRVETVSSVPSSTGSFMTRDLKEYEAVIRVLADESRVTQLRPGLTAEIEVLVSSRDDVLQAPIQSIVTVVGQQVAFVITGDHSELRKVKIGQTNDRMIEIQDGLKDGELVAMNPRSYFERELKDLETQLIAEQARKAAEEGSKPGARQGGVPGLPLPGAGGPEGAPRPAAPPTGSDDPGRPMNPVALFERMDTNKDGKLTQDEWSERFASRARDLDVDKDGSVSRQEFQTGFAARPQGPRAPVNGLPPEQAGG